MNRIILAVALFALAAAPARAEIDFSGSWVSINHEDAMERGAGPNPADWAGLPLNESGRAKALAFNRISPSAPSRVASISRSMRSMIPLRTPCGATSRLR